VDLLGLKGIRAYPQCWNKNLIEEDFNRIRKVATKAFGEVKIPNRSLPSSANWEKRPEDLF